MVIFILPIYSSGGDLNHQPGKNDAAVLLICLSVEDLSHQLGEKEMLCPFDGYCDTCGVKHIPKKMSASELECLKIRQD